MTRNRLSMFDNNFEDLEKEKYPIWENACECVRTPARPPRNHNSKQQTPWRTQPHTHNHHYHFIIAIFNKIYDFALAEN